MKNSHPPIVQISLDLTDIKEAIETARIAIESGVDWLEAGTPLILAEGLHGVRALRREFPDHPIIADLKTMDGGYLEAEMMAKAGATHVVVMARAHAETIKCVVKGNHIEHWLNDVKVLEFERGGEKLKQHIAESKFKNTNGFGETAKGHILLQDHGDAVWYRNIKIRTLK